MNKAITFRAVIEDAGGGGACVTIPFDIEKTYGKKRVKVKALIEGEVYRGSLVRMGGECHILGVRKEIRQKIGKSVGDEIEITIEEDTEPREVLIPADLLEALASDAQAATRFRQLSYTHQKEYVQWIEEGKRQITRQKRIEQTLQRLKNSSE